MSYADEIEELSYESDHLGHVEASEIFDEEKEYMEDSGLSEDDAGRLAFEVVRRYSAKLEEGEDVENLIWSIRNHVEEHQDDIDDWEEVDRWKKSCDVCGYERVIDSLRNIQPGTMCPECYFSELWVEGQKDESMSLMGDE